MNYLLEDAVDFFGDFLADGRREEVPDFLGRRGHDSFSFTKPSRSQTAAAVSLERIDVVAKPERLVQR
jgi:hypothetical protein